MINPASGNLWKQFEALVPAQDLAPPVAQTPMRSDSYQPTPAALPIYQPQYIPPAAASNVLASPAAPVAAEPTTTLTPADAPTTPQNLQQQILADQQSSFQIREDAIFKENEAYAQINGDASCQPASGSTGILPFGWG